MYTLFYLVVFPCDIKMVTTNRSVRKAHSQICNKTKFCQKKKMHRICNISPVGRNADVLLEIAIHNAKIPLKFDRYYFNYSCTQLQLSKGYFSLTIAIQ